MKIIHFLIFTLTFILPLGQLSRIPLTQFPNVGIYLHDIIITISVLIWIRYHRITGKPFREPPLTKPIGLFFLAGLFSLLVNTGAHSLPELITGGLYLIRWILYALLYFMMYEITIQDETNKTGLKIYVGLTATGTAIALGGLAQYVLYPNLRNLYYLGWDPHEYRVFGTFFDSGFIGLLLVFTLLQITLMLFYRQTTITKGMRITLTIGYLLTFIAFALTYSRSSYLAFLGGILLLAWQKRSKFLFASIAALMIITLLLLPNPSSTSEAVKLDRTSTITARIENYQFAVTLIEEKPIVGRGFNLLRYENNSNETTQHQNRIPDHAASGVDASLLFVWATTGIVGLVAYLYLWLRILKPRIANNTDNAAYRDLLRITLYALTSATFIHSLFQNSLFYPWVMIWLWLILGIYHALYKSTKAENTKQFRNSILS